MQSMTWDQCDLCDLLGALKPTNIFSVPRTISTNHTLEMAGDLWYLSKFQKVDLPH